ncbi:hypothetical protein [Flavobacterium polysaccharolyticum]|uniref:DUF4465 domain-containing protein n=1 Tax=Flavobacterium polysaccharolyticum TaxID=3133148 RepID=A0ABU9NJG5_9FLAO
MKKIKTILAFLTVSLVAVSCSKDNEETKTEPTTTELKYSNGSLITGTTSTSGAVAQAGYSWSELPSGATNIGFNATGDSKLADDFTVPTGEKWTINKFIFYAYQTGYTGTSNPINEIKYSLYDTNPSIAGATPIYGDFTINKYVSGEEAKIYRIVKNSSETTRKVFKITTSATDLVLMPGTYWIAWKSKNNDNFIYFPNNETNNATLNAKFNAIQQIGSTWSVLNNGGTEQTKIDFPFEIVGTKTKL